MERHTVTVREGTEVTAALSPDGRRIALIFLGQAWLMDARGGRALPLTDAVSDPHEVWALAWAPDSRRIAVLPLKPPLSPDETRTSTLMLLDADTRAVVRMWTAPVLIGVSWSPSDDAPIAVELGRDSTIMWKFPVDSGREPQRLRAVPRLAGEPAFGPGGHAIVHAAPISGASWMATSATDLWELDLATGAERRLTADSTLDASPSVSPDGRWIAYISERSGARQLWLLSRDGGAPRPLSVPREDTYLAPLSWLPDSRGVMYTAAGKIHVAFVDGSPDATIPFHADIAVARWRGLRRPALPAPGERKRARGIVTPELSPDGRRIAFAALGDLWVADFDGGAPRRLTASIGDEILPRWSPDGTRLAYVVNAPGVDRHVRILDVERAADSRTVAVPVSQFGFQLQWSPEGRRLAWVEGNRIGWTEIGSGATRVVANTAGRLLGWSARGDSITYASGNRSWRVSADSGAPVAWSAAPASAWRAQWSADFSRAAYAHATRGYHLDVAGGGAPIAIADPAPRSFSWSSDGRYLLYLTGADIRLLDTRSGSGRTLDVAPWYEVAAAPPPVLIRNVRIVDGTGAAPSAASDVFVANGRIAEISAAGAMSRRVATRTIDAGGRTLLPGLINHHAHQTASKPLLPLYIYNGVLSIRDPGPQGDWIQSQRERAESGELLAPRVFAVGALVSALVGVDLRDSASVSQQLRSIAAVGTDIIKAYHRNPVLDAQVSEAAHALGLPMTSHFLFLGSLARGLEGKEHAALFYKGWTALYRDDVISVLRAADACVTPTLLYYAVNNLGGVSPRMSVDTSIFSDATVRELTPPGLLAEARAWLRRPRSAAARSAAIQNEAWDLESTRRLREAGVRIATGTDVVGLLEEFGTALEMELLVRGGFTPLQAIRAGTLDGASCLGVDNELGSVQVGKRADMIIVDGDPATDIRDIRRIVWIIHGGVPYMRHEVARAALSPPRSGSQN